MNEIVLNITSVLKNVFSVISGLFEKISPEFGLLILLAISVAGSFYLLKAYENGKIRRWIFIIILSLIFFLMMVFSMGGN
mgnify:CR=1 FL=1